MNTALIFEELEGQTVDGRFPLLERLGGSGNSAVFRTRGPDLPKAVIKVRPADGTAGAEALVRQWQQARSLSHPNLTRVYESGRAQVGDSELLYVVMEYADEVLSHALREMALEAAAVRETLVPLLSALSYLHGRRLVHGHLKPSNVLLVEGAVKLSGDSLLRLPSASNPGRPDGHDAPEMATGPVTEAADIWSLGMTIAEMLTQHVPSRWTDAGLVLSETLPDPYSDVVRACLRTVPAQRCTVEEIRVVLESEAQAAARAAVPVRAAAPAGPRGTAASVSRPPLASRPAEPAPGPVVTIALPAWMDRYARWFREHPDWYPELREKLLARTAGVRERARQLRGRIERSAADAPFPVVPVSVGALLLFLLVIFLATRGHGPDATAEVQGAHPALRPAGIAKPSPYRDETRDVPRPQASPVSDGDDGVVAARPPVAPPARQTGYLIPAGGSAGSPGGSGGAVLSRVSPRVVPSAIDSIRGTVRVTLEVSVDANGNVSRMAYLSPGPSPYFARAAGEAAQAWKFRPPVRGGSPAGSAWILEFSFTRDGVTASAEQNM